MQQIIITELGSVELGFETVAVTKAY